MDKDKEEEKAKHNGPEDANPKDGKDEMNDEGEPRKIDNPKYHRDDTKDIRKYAEIVKTAYGR